MNNLCPQCLYENRATARFCAECGAVLEIESDDLELEDRKTTTLEPADEEAENRQCGRAQYLLLGQRCDVGKSVELSGKPSYLIGRNVPGTFGRPRDMNPVPGTFPRANFAECRPCSMIHRQ